jgi:hypothetical protein
MLPEYPGPDDPLSGRPEFSLSPQPVITIVETRRAGKAQALESVMSHDQIITVVLAVVVPALLMNSIGIAMMISAGIRSLARGTARHALRFAVVRAR